MLGAEVQECESENGERKKKGSPPLPLLYSPSARLRFSGRALYFAPLVHSPAVSTHAYVRVQCGDSVTTWASMISDVARRAHR